MLARQFFDLVVIDGFRFGVEAVGDRMIKLAADVDRGAVGQVTAMRKRHAEYGVAGTQDRGIHREIGLRTRMRLDVRVFRLEQLAGAVDRELLGDVDVLAAAVITFAGITLGILVGQQRALRFEHARTRVILGSNQLDMVLLPLRLAGERRRQFGIKAGDGFLI